MRSRRHDAVAYEATRLYSISEKFLDTFASPGRTSVAGSIEDHLSAKRSMPPFCTETLQFRSVTSLPTAGTRSHCSFLTRSVTQPVQSATFTCSALTLSLATTASFPTTWARTLYVWDYEPPSNESGEGAAS
jgi:hypothetical protein